MRKWIERLRSLGKSINIVGEFNILLLITEETSSNPQKTQDMI